VKNQFGIETILQTAAALTIDVSQCQ